VGDNQIKENLKFSVEIVSGSLYKFVLFIDIFLLLPRAFSDFCQVLLGLFHT